MVRTKADNTARKAVAAKAPRKVLGSSSSGGAGASGMGSPAGKATKYAGGNIACPRPTPDWQKNIDAFFCAGAQAKDKENEPENNGSPEDSCDATALATDSPIKNSSGESQAASPVKRNGVIESDDDDD